MLRGGLREAVLKDYFILMDVMDKIHCSTHNEYSLRAKGILHEFEKFEMLFGLKMGHLYTLWRCGGSHQMLSSKRYCS